MALALGIFVVSMVLSELAGPSPLISGLLLLTLILCAWLFGWRGGLLSLVSMTALLITSPRVDLREALRHAVWFVPLVIGTGYRLVVCLTVGGLHFLTKALLSTRETLVRMERTCQQEHARNARQDQVVLQNLRHELCTPLTQVQGYLDLLVTFQEQCDATTQAQFIVAAQRGCDDLLNVVETSLLAAQTKTPQQSLHTSAFPLKHEMQTVLAGFGPPFLRDHPVKLEIEESMQVCADRRLVRQVVRNLLTNVSKYTPPATEVTVSAAPIGAAQEPHGRADMICVRVKDQGPGIAPEHLPLVFQRGMRLPQAQESTQPGMGLGLSICKHLVEVMGGAMWAESTGRAGEGCCFCFTLARGGAPVTCEPVKRKGGSHDWTQMLLLRPEQEQHAAVSTWGRR